MQNYVKHKMLPPKRLLSNSAIGLLLTGVLLLLILQTPWHLSAFISCTSLACLLLSIRLYRPLLLSIRKISRLFLPYWSGMLAASAWLILAGSSICLVYLFPALARFNHIYELPGAEILAVLSLPVFGLSLWLISLRFLESDTTHSLIKWIVGAIPPILIASFWLPATLVYIGSLIWLITFRVYLKDNRSSLTWLLGWLLLIAANPAYTLAESYHWTKPASLAFFSSLFLSSFLLSLALRGLISLRKISLQSYQIPLGGAESLRFRIQLYILGLTLFAFVLIAWFNLSAQANLPAEDSAAWMEQLLTAYVLLLLVAGTVGIAIANSITDPLIQISKRIEQTNLSKNEPIRWHRQDEIGLIVKKYNQMIADLERSAQQLAEQERESAWREMAQQVAHEIKNPLTPMRLHLQQLIRLHKEDPDRALAWSKNSAHVLLEQIEVLNRIASEFSHFAKLPKAHLQTFLLSEVITEVVALFSKNEAKADIQLDIDAEEVSVKVDRDHLSRVLINLLRNALQAVPTEGKGLIKISLSQQEQQALIQMEDNGQGIPLEIQDKIFQPRFTTKSSGTGLGLAMCKNMIERMQGRIWFVSQPQPSTIFYVSLPIVNPALGQLSKTSAQTVAKSFS